MACEAFVEFSNLLAEVLFLDVEKSFGVSFFEAADEETEESFNEVFEAFEHRFSKC